MKINIEYSDPYRFLVSAGILLISLSLLLPWLLLQVSLDIVISAVDLAQLTPAAQAIVERRQASALSLIENVGFVSALFAASGFLCLLFGLLFWYRRYRQQEGLEILEEQQRRREAQQLAPDPYNVTLQIARRDLGMEPQSSDPYIPSDIGLEDLDAAWWIEQKVKIYGNLAKVFRRTHRIRPEFEVCGDRYILLESRQLDNPGALVRLIPVRATSETQWFVNVIARTALSHQLLKANYPPNFMHFTIFVLRREQLQPSESTTAAIKNALTDAASTNRWECLTDTDSLLNNGEVWTKKLFKTALTEPLADRARASLTDLRLNARFILVWMVLPTIATALALLAMRGILRTLFNPNTALTIAILTATALALIAVTRSIYAHSISTDGYIEIVEEGDSWSRTLGSSIYRFRLSRWRLKQSFRTPALSDLGIRNVVVRPVSRGSIYLEVHGESSELSVYLRLEAGVLELLPSFTSGTPFDLYHPLRHVTAQLVTHQLEGFDGLLPNSL